MNKHTFSTVNSVLAICAVILFILPQCIKAQRPGINIISPGVQPDNSVVFRLKVANADSLASQRQGDARTPYTLIQNLDRVRVVVK